MVQLVLPSRQSKPRLYSLCQSRRTGVVGYIRRAKVHSPGSFQSGGMGKLLYSQAGYVRKGRCANNVHTTNAQPTAGSRNRPALILVTSIEDGENRATIDASAGKVDGEGRIAAEEVGEFAIVVAIVDGEIGQFSGLERADLLSAPQA